MRFLLIMMMLLASAAQAENTPNTAPPLSEYDNVKPGMLLQDRGPAMQDPKEEDPLNIATAAMTFEDMLEAHRQGNYAVIAKPVAVLVESGHIPATELFGIMHRTGQGVPKNPEKALFWLTKAADANRPLAQHHLGVIYFTGDGVQEDPVKALMWLHIAVVHYSDGPDKIRALADRQNISASLPRRDHDRALQMARDWLAKKGEAYLLDKEQENAP